MVEVMVDVWRVSNQQNTFDEEFDGVGKLLSWDVQIPAKFGVSSFTRKTQLHTMLMHHRRGIATLMKKIETH
jgi:hypothetical protein